MSTGDRLREERERLDLSQERFATLGGVLKRAQIHYEKGERNPDSGYLAAVAAAGVDVLYVLTGSRDPALPVLDTSERLLVDNYRRCKQEARVHLIQTSALLAAGIETAAPRARATKTASSGLRQSSTGSHAVQVGSAGGDVVVGRGRR